MKRLWWIILFASLISLIGVYAYLHLSEERTQEHIIHYQTSEFRVLDIPLKQIDYSPIVSAILYSHLKEGSLMLTFQCTVMSDQPLEGDLYCRMESNGLKIRQVLSLGDSRPSQGHFVTEGSFQYNLSELLSVGGSEDDVFSFLKSLQKEPHEYIKYIGCKEDDKEYPI